ncbi:hypothetical protein, partial [Brevibacterium casei]|uniref:hypothetical protein n=1 Tax=Brevibacterium casei TaxID=33889 RepID=UPI001C92CF1E
MVTGSDFRDPSLLCSVLLDVFSRGWNFNDCGFVRDVMVGGHPPAGSHPGQVGECQGVVDVDGLVG